MKSNKCVKENLPWLHEIIKEGMYETKFKANELYNTSKYTDYRYLNDISFKKLNLHYKELKDTECFNTQTKFINFFRILNPNGFSKTENNGKIHYVYPMYFINLEKTDESSNPEIRLYFDLYFLENGKLDFIFIGHPIIISCG